MVLSFFEEQLVNVPPPCVQDQQAVMRQNCTITYSTKQAYTDLITYHDLLTAVALRPDEYVVLYPYSCLPSDCLRDHSKMHPWKFFTLREEVSCKSTIYCSYRLTAQDSTSLWSGKGMVSQNGDLLSSPLEKPWPRENIHLAPSKQSTKPDHVRSLPGVFTQWDNHAVINLSWSAPHWGSATMCWLTVTTIKPPGLAACSTWVQDKHQVSWLPAACLR